MCIRDSHAPGAPADGARGVRPFPARAAPRLPARRRGATGGPGRAAVTAGTSVEQSAGTVAVVGTGLIGTSVALALRDTGRRVLLVDRDAGRLALAVDRGAGECWDGGEPVWHTVLAVPPAAVAGELRRLQDRELSATYSDVASVKVAPQWAAEAAGADLTTFCGGHPVAGRERGGPAAARHDLFVGRPWVLTPGSLTGRPARAAAAEVARACGATVVEMSPVEHDRALGLVSHVPQLVASLLAARLADAPELAVSLAGQGLRDTTRIAASDPRLWAEVVDANAGPVLEVLEAYAADLDDLLAALRSGAGEGRGAGPVGGLAPEAVAEVVRRGNAGRARLPGKHGVPSGEFATVPVVVEDAPGRPVGVAELAVQPDGVDRLLAVLRARGWAVYAPDPAVERTR